MFTGEGKTCEKIQSRRTDRQTIDGKSSFGLWPGELKMKTLNKLILKMEITDFVNRCLLDAEIN